MKFDIAQDLSYVRLTIRAKEVEVAEAFFDCFDVSHPGIHVTVNGKNDTIISIARSAYGIALRFLEMIGSTDEGQQTKLNRFYCSILWIQEKDAMGTNIDDILKRMRGGDGGNSKKLH